jgi:hypothetical protein
MTIYLVAQEADKSVRRTPYLLRVTRSPLTKIFDDALRIGEKSGEVCEIQ